MQELHIPFLGKINNVIIILLLSFNSIYGQVYKSYLSDAQKENILNIKDNKDTSIVYLSYPLFDSTELELVFNKGSLVMETFKVQGKFNGIRLSYNNNKIVESCSYDMGCRDGKYISYYPSGLLKTLGNYICLNRDTTCIVEEFNVFNQEEEGTSILYTEPFHSPKDGIWRYYLENGSVLKEELWKNGKCIKSTWK